MTETPGKRSRPFSGAALLAVGRKEGMARFGDTPQAFLASLAPWIAFPLVGAVLMVASETLLDAVGTLLLTVVAQLSPPVLSHVLAVRWGREGDWLRYATAFNWCQWAIPAVLFLLLVVAQAGGGGGLPSPHAVQVVVLAVAAYAVWLHWVIARHGLRLGWARAAVLVVLVNSGTVALVWGPHLVQVWAVGAPAVPAKGSVP